MKVFGRELFTKAQEIEEMRREIIAKNSVIHQDIRPYMDHTEVLDVGDGVKLPWYPKSLVDLYDVARYSDILRIIIHSIKQETFRNGFDEPFPIFEYKCTKCEKEFNNEPEGNICDACGSALRKPDSSEEKKIDYLKDNAVNENGQKLVDVLGQLEDDLNIADVAFLMFFKDYVIDDDGNILVETVKEILRGNPVNMQIIADREGRPGRNNNGIPVWTCINHREQFIANEKVPKCPQDGLLMHRAHFVTGYYEHGQGQYTQKDSKKKYYLQHEVFKLSKYMTQLTYGHPPILPVWMKVITLMNMDRYVLKYYGQQRPPNSLLLVNTRVASGLQKAWEWVLEKSKLQPHIPVPLPVESNSSRGQVAQVIRLMEPLADMQFIESRNEYRRIVGSVYGVSPLFHADFSQGGGLNNEGLMLTVTNRAVESSQQVQNAFIKEILGQKGIIDYVLQLAPNEEKDEMAEKHLFAQEVNNAMNMRSLGFEVELSEDQTFTYTKNPNLPAFQLPQQQGEIGTEQRFTGEPESVRRSLTIYKVGETDNEREDFEKSITFMKEIQSKNNFKKDEEVSYDSIFDKHIGEIEEITKKQIRGPVMSKELRESIERSIFSRKFKGLSRLQSTRVKNALINAFRTKATMQELVNTLNKIAPKVIDENKAELIIRTEQTSMANTAREYAFRKTDPDEEKLYKWLGPNDRRTTEICKNISRRSSKGVSIRELKNMVEEEATKAGMEPREWVPHPQCRHVVSRKL